MYRPGESLPSLRAMAIQLHVNPNTVQRAYDELEREGLIYVRRGRGLFVAPRGTASAQSTAGNGIRRLLFDDAIRAGQTAGMSAEQVQKIFDAALQARRPIREETPMNAPAPVDDCPAIELVGLTKRFGRTLAVDDLSLNIPRGLSQCLAADRENGAVPFGCKGFLSGCPLSKGGRM